MEAAVTVSQRRPTAGLKPSLAGPSPERLQQASNARGAQRGYSAPSSRGFLVSAALPLWRSTPVEASPRDKDLGERLQFHIVATRLIRSACGRLLMDAGTKNQVAKGPRTKTKGEQEISQHLAAGRPTVRDRVSLDPKQMISIGLRCRRRRHTQKSRKMRSKTAWSFYRSTGAPPQVNRRSRRSYALLRPNGDWRPSPWS